MAESDKIQSKRLDDNSDFTFWSIPLMALNSAKGIDMGFVTKKGMEKHPVR